jgi:hypothetical protein
MWWDGPYPNIRMRLGLSGSKQSSKRRIAASRADIARGLGSEKQKKRLNDKSETQILLMARKWLNVIGLA